MIRLQQGEKRNDEGYCFNQADLLEYFPDGCNVLPDAPSLPPTTAVLCHNEAKMLVVASGEISGGNILSFKAFPTQPHLLNFVITFHIAGEVKGEISYRVRKWEDVIYQTEPTLFSLPDTESGKQFKHADSIELVFPSQGYYHLDFLFDGALLQSFPFSVFDSSNRADLEREIIYYLKAKAKRGAKSVQEITRGVYNPKLLNRANIREFSAKIYFVLLRMKEVANINAEQQGTLEDKMNGSRWKLKE